MNRFTPALLALVSCASAAPSQSVPTPEAKLTPSAEKVLAVDAARPSRKQLVRRILPHNVRLVLSDGDKARRTASGVVIGNERTSKGTTSYIVTNAHAVVTDDLKDPRIVITLERQGEVMEYAVEVVATGRVPEMDLALLRVRGVELSPAELAQDTELELGEDVVVAASPFGKAISLSGGMLSQVEWDRESKRPRMVKTDAPIGYGASGGGIFSLETGKLLAIVEGYRTAKVGFAVANQDFSFDVPMPGETFAAPSTKVRQFLEEKGYGRLLSRAVPAETGSAPTAQR